MFNLLCTSPPPHPPPPSPPHLPPLSAKLYASVNSRKCFTVPGKKLSLHNGICSCGDKMHGAPGWETGLFCPILAVPLNIALHIP
jgi:hypothetical protein